MEESLLPSQFVREFKARVFAQQLIDIQLAKAVVGVPRLLLIGIVGLYLKNSATRMNFGQMAYF